MTEADVSDVAKQISDISMEIDLLTTQIGPVSERIKTLKKQKTELKKQLAPAMVNLDVKKINTPAVEINLKSNSARVRPYNKETVHDALEAYKTDKLPEMVVDDVLEFIDAYRQENKIISSSVTLKKTKDYVPAQVPAVQPLRLGVTSTPRHPMAPVQPYQL